MLSGEGQLSFVIDGPVFELEFLAKLKKKIKTDLEAFKMLNIKFERLTERPVGCSQSQELKLCLPWSARR